ncbi:hypothetical protein Q669_26400 [Labrenzia sp. C1B10]|nr:hypothetical protein Q669_26400 [Labrenzia sp. C1B10]ERS08804.1 hypothetical protein Q675_15455 [Labrenzia sp. C1B70]
MSFAAIDKIFFFGDPDIEIAAIVQPHGNCAPICRR